MRFGGVEGVGGVGVVEGEAGEEDAGFVGGEFGEGVAFEEVIGVGYGSGEEE